MRHDAIVIGGSYAGLAAATQLARARRRVLVIDGGQRRNRRAGRSHGFLTQDGTPAAEIAALGRAQLLAYDTVSWLDGTATHATRAPSGFAVQLADGTRHEAARLVLATGVVDQLPALPGLAERWGRRVFHCPYCHGYELDRGPIGVLATSPQALHLALMLPDWGPTTLFLDDTFDPDPDQRAQLAARGVALRTGAVARLDGELDVVMADGTVATLAGLFVAVRADVAGPLPAQLGCALDESAMGSFIRTDMTKETSVPGVFACGDAARQPHSVTFAAGDGAMAGVATHRSLIFGSA